MSKTRDSEAPDRSITREDLFPIPPEALFDALVTPSAIRSWWNASNAIVAPVAGGVWAATWGGTGDAPEFVVSATLEAFERPGRILMSGFRYLSPQGPLPFDSSRLATEFLVAPAEGGARLTVTQYGFPGTPDADVFFAGCVTGWEKTFDGIRTFCR